MPRGKSSKEVEQYEHKDKKRMNNPPVGLVTPETDKESRKKRYEYDPHLDPQLIWSGKAEHTSFEIDTVSLHVHERIDPYTIIKQVKKEKTSQIQLPLFESPENNPPLREAIDFYKHKQDWTNRLIAGDSLLVMNSLIEKEGMAGKVQMIYIDPPYGIKYGSNFQPFVNKRDVKDGKDEDLTQEPEMIKAFRDTWELGIHSYLGYLRDRLLLARDLLTESGSVFVQISDENVHLVRYLMDEIFGVGNFVSEIVFTKTRSLVSSDFLTTITDYLLWYSKDIEKAKTKMRKLYEIRTDNSLASHYEDENGNIYSRAEGERLIEENPKIKLRAFKSDDLIREANPVFKLEFNGKTFSGSYRTNPEGMKRLIEKNRIFATKNQLRYKFFLDDFPASPLNQLWADTIGTTNKIYVVQTNQKIIQRCILMTTDPGDLVFDPTCGSGTTAYVAEHWGRRWITCDTSRVAITLAKERLMTALYNYYELAHPEEGVSSGFNYKTVPHITLKSITNNEPPAQETLYDQPYIDRSKVRISGPFTVEAVPSPVVRPIDEIEEETVADSSVARSDEETLRHVEWRDELLKTGIRGKNGKMLIFSRVEALPGTRWLHADAETKEDEPKRAVISFGPMHAPLEQRQVALAIEEALTLAPKPKIVVFASFQFDPEAAKDIDGTRWPGVTLLKVQMNTDLFTEDLKKKRVSNQSFWLMGQPDVELRRRDDGRYEVEVLGFDYYNPKTGSIESGGTEKIAMWMLDTDYDGRSLYSRQVFFPMAGKGGGWAKLAKSLKAQIDMDLIEMYRGTISLPFEVGEDQNQRVAVKIIDDRGIESLKMLEV